MAEAVGVNRDDGLDPRRVVHYRNRPVASSCAPVKLDGEEDKRRWYCVCSRCGAKAFSVRKSFACPRCSIRLRTREHILPPWHR